MKSKVTRRAFFGVGVAAASAAAVGGGLAMTHATHVVAVVDQGLAPLDAVGPMEVLARLPDAKGIYASQAGGSVRVARGPLTLHDTDPLSSVARADVIVLAGGAQRPGPDAIAWLRSAEAKARLVLAAGDGARWLETAGIKRDGRRVVATAGGAAAIDAALAGAALLENETYAKALQLGIEYDPAPPFRIDEAAEVEPGGIAPLSVAILLYEGMTALDAIGPYEVLSRVPNVAITLIGPGTAPINTDTGDLFLGVDRDFGGAGPFDLVVVPGGSVGTLQAARNDRLLEWLAAQTQVKSTRVMSICTGALILGGTGILAGKKATTHWASEASLVELGAQFVHERFVANGNIVTAAGVSAGIDVALAIVGELRGRALGAAIQRALPYDPRPPFDMGALPKASPQVIDAANAELTSNAIGSLARMALRRRPTV